jgi:hypothetical protein
MVVGSEMDIDVVGSVPGCVVAYTNPNPNPTICLPASGIIFQHKIQMKPNHSYARVSLNCAGCGKKPLNELNKYLLTFSSTSRSPTTITISNKSPHQDHHISTLRTSYPYTNTKHTHRNHGQRSKSSLEA